MCVSAVNDPLLRFWVEVGAVTMYSPRTRAVISLPSGVCATGTVMVDAAFSLDDAAEPYEVVIVPAALPQGVEPRLTKDQYDDLLNFLDAYHPLGVEVVTRGIRGFVHGFREPPGWSQLPTAATFPTYRTGR